MEKYLKYKFKYLSLAGASGETGIVIEDKKGNGYYLSEYIQKTCLTDDGCWYFEIYIPEGTYCLTKKDGTKKTIDDEYLKSIKDRIKIPSSILLGMSDSSQYDYHYDVIKINSINIINIFKNSITIEFNINIQRREKKNMRSRQSPLIIIEYIQKNVS